MWNYEKRLQFPVNIKTPNAKLALFIMSQYGGPDGEIGASMRYLSQRFTMPNRIAMGTLNDIGTEELAHLEIVSTIVHQLTRNLSMEEIEQSGLGPYYIDHTVGIWPQAAGGIPFNACEFQSKGDPITDLFEDLAAVIMQSMVHSQPCRSSCSGCRYHGRYVFSAQSYAIRARIWKSMPSARKHTKSVRDTA